MQRTTSKLMGVLIATLLCAAAATTANSQEQSGAGVSRIYCVDNDGMLKEYFARDAQTDFALPHDVGVGWGDYRSVFSGGHGVIYGISQDGVLVWLGYASRSWVGPKNVGRGWGGFQQVFSAGRGIIYAITQDGKLRWYKHNGYLTGAGLDTPGTWEGPKEVGHGWAEFRNVFPGGDGIIYAITQDGKLRWYKHNGYLNGAGLETPGAWEGPKEAGHGWADFKHVFSQGAGIIFAITQDGKLLSYKHNGYLTGTGLDTPGSWEARKEVGRGLSDFIHVFALLDDTSESRAMRSSSIEEKETISLQQERLNERKATGNVSDDSFDKLKRRNPLQPENTIKVSVRYKKEFGYLGDTNAFGNVGPTSCNAFSVSVVVGDGAAAQRIPLRISSDSKMEEISDYYFCNYLVSDVPLNQPVRVSVGLSGFDQSVPWKGGSQTQPAPGQQRTIIIVSGREGAPMTLTATQPRARQLFEMVYTSQPR